MTKKIGLFVNTTKENAKQVVADVIALLKSKEVQPLIPNEQALLLGLTQTGISTEQMVDAAELVIVLGGDGTLLSAAHTINIENVPILAINIGNLGFLTDASIYDLIPTLKATLNGEYRIEHRMMLEVSVNYHGKQTFHAYALNDVVIREYTRLIELDAYVDGEFFIPYNADGLIVATPSGSTGYSMSGGGTIVAPQLEAILLTPIAPHSLTVRPFIAHGDAEIKVEMHSTYESLDLFIDGQRETHTLTRDAAIIIKKADRTIQLIRSKNHSYYKALREKLMLGERIK
ncbi:NAD(+) kinase [Candidatus Poribacteria bacterium]|nr:NAD(+) kinase [Candidatus Poribacteria bacterium]MYF54510.1 NAD(+) kinase [Candidatus Poribacteria bacterium]